MLAQPRIGRSLSVREPAGSGKYGGRSENRSNGRGFIVSVSKRPLGLGKVVGRLAQCVANLEDFLHPSAARVVVFARDVEGGQERDFRVVEGSLVSGDISNGVVDPRRESAEAPFVRSAEPKTPSADLDDDDGGSGGRSGGILNHEN